MNNEELLKKAKRIFDQYRRNFKHSENDFDEYMIDEITKKLHRIEDVGPVNQDELEEIMQSEISRGYAVKDFDSNMNEILLEEGDISYFDGEFSCSELVVKDWRDRVYGDENRFVDFIIYELILEKFNELSQK